MKIFRMSALDILSIFHFMKWKLTWGRNNEPKGGFFDLRGNNLAIRVPFNRRSLVTRLSKIFKKLRECVFLPGKSNLAIFFEKKLWTMKTTQKTGYFSRFYVVNHVVKLFSSLFFHKKILLLVSNNSAEKIHCNVIHSRENRFFSSKKMPA